MQRQPILFATLVSGSLIAGLIVGLIQLQAQAPKPSEAAASTSEPRAVLVELFTSEGCSSCPPADALLKQIDGMRTDGGQLIVGVSEHVTYWNSLGWADPFSASAYTDRQNAYGERFRLDSVYTPQMVINGDAQIVGSDKSGLLRALAKEGQRAQDDLHITSATANGSELTVGFRFKGSAEGKGTDIFAVLADDVTSSHVLRGENSGRTLVHASVARVITRVATVRGATEQTVHVSLPSTFLEKTGKGRHLILFAQSEGLGRVVGVDTKAL